MRGAGMMLVGCVLVAGCGEKSVQQGADNAVVVATPTVPVAVGPVPAPVVGPMGAWIGKWVGVEGLALDIRAGDAPGTYRLHIALMDGAGDYAGTADGDVIRFTRDGVAETIRHTNGADTGLKWLAAKTDCLTIKPGEGFCRG